MNHFCILGRCRVSSLLAIWPNTWNCKATISSVLHQSCENTLYCHVSVLDLLQNCKIAVKFYSPAWERQEIPACTINITFTCVLFSITSATHSDTLYESPAITSFFVILFHSNWSSAHGRQQKVGDFSLLSVASCLLRDPLVLIWVRKHLEMPLVGINQCKKKKKSWFIELFQGVYNWSQLIKQQKIHNGKWKVN